MVKINKPILLLILILVAPLTLALVSESENYRIEYTISSPSEASSENVKVTSVMTPFSNNYSGIYSGFLSIPEAEETTTTESDAVGGGGGSGSAGKVQTTPREISPLKEAESNLTELLCRSDPSFVERFLSKCTIDNGVCDDGEIVLINEDCNLGLRDFMTGTFLKYVWFIKFVILFSIILLFRNSKLFPFSVTIILFLLIYNQAFIPSGFDYNSRDCLDARYLVNLGYCIMPAHPLIGWVTSIIILGLIITYFRKDFIKIKKRKPKTKNYINNL